jgi:hypothetical protein
LHRGWVSAAVGKYSDAVVIPKFLHPSGSDLESADDAALERYHCWKIYCFAEDTRIDIAIKVILAGAIFGGLSLEYLEMCSVENITNP